MPKFSDRYLMGLRSKDKPYQVRDTKGFAVRVLPTGTKTFLFIYEKDGKRKQLNLGNYPATTLAEGRRRYHYAQTALLRGEPLEPPKEVVLVIEKVITLRVALKHYIEFISKEKQGTRWVNYKKRSVEKYLNDFLDKDIRLITRTDMKEVLADLQRTRSSVFSYYKALSPVFEFAVLQDWVLGSPFTKLTKIIPNMRAGIKDRSLSIEEIKVLWPALETGRGSDSAKRILKLTLLTAQRPGEVLGMHRREISGDWWTIPPERNGKGKRHHRVFLTATAKELIGDREGYIFPTVWTDKEQPIATITASRTVRAANYYGLPKWTPHDLRRTACTHMARLRIPEEHSEAIMNHAKEGMVKIYNTYGYDDEKQEALIKWEAELLRIVNA